MFKFNKVYIGLAQNGNRDIYPSFVKKSMQESIMIYVEYIKIFKTSPLPKNSIS